VERGGFYNLPLLLPIFRSHPSTALGEGVPDGEVQVLGAGFAEEFLA